MTYSLAIYLLVAGYLLDAEVFVMQKLAFSGHVVAFCPLHVSTGEARLNRISHWKQRNASPGTIRKAVNNITAMSLISFITFKH